MKVSFYYQLFVGGMASMNEEIGNGKFDRMLDGGFSGGFNVVRREDGALRYNESCDALENSQKCEDRCFNEAEECYLSCENQEK